MATTSFSELLQSDMIIDKYIKIIDVVSHEDCDHVRKLVYHFVNWHRVRHLEDLELIDEYFDRKDFEKELESLPGKYSRPNGRLLLALFDGEPAGCVALRKIDDQAFEMKRMFVYTKYHGKGIGRALAEKFINEARLIGYQSIKLDTSFRQIEAQKLYQSLGFNVTRPYYQLPKKLEDWLVFMEMKL
ncbi:MAG: GNAT family N-acetyltransferase [Ginsengibacter sp.]